MNFKDKLRQIDPTLVSSRKHENCLDQNPIENVVAGEYVQTPYGACFFTEQLFTSEMVPGKIDIFRLLNKSATLFALVGKDTNLGKVALDRTIFLDTETTGLAGGAGTYILLVGLGFFTERGFKIEQYFLRNYNEELAFLDCLKKRLSNYNALVSFNGKSYDLPLLKTRFALARLDSNGLPTLHLDLLFTARRFWQRYLENCRLASVEEHILGIQRKSDVPGSLIPHLYFNYLQTGNAAPLKAVFAHNQQDVLTLVALTTHVCELFDQTSPQPISMREYASMARVYEELADYEKCISFYERIRTQTKNLQRFQEISTRLSLVYKRLGKWEKATTVWKEQLERGCPSIFPFVELAKYYEHIARDYSEALTYVQKAWHWVEMKELFQAGFASEEIRNELLHRMRRLKQKRLLLALSSNVNQQEFY